MSCIGGKLSKLSEELRGKTEEEAAYILTFVSHIDLKKEFVALCREVHGVDEVINGS